MNPSVGSVSLALAAVLTGALSLSGHEVDERRLRPVAAPVGAALPDPNGAPLVQRVARPAKPLPSAAAMRRAWRYARRRGGQVSIAVVDSKGHLRGRRARQRYVSASLVKALVLVAELRRLEREKLPLDAGTAALLEAMITFSDNDAANVIYSRSGDAGLLDVARSAGMRRITVGGYWAYTQLTAGDMARFFSRLEQLAAEPHRRFALRLLASIVPEQSWGIPRAAGRQWRVCFKGGWRATETGQLVHQAARLRNDDQKLAVAILTDGQPSQLHAIHTVRGVADRLLRIPN